MELYDGGSAPNPRRVNLFIAEKAIEIKRIKVDMGKLEHKGDVISKLNPLQRLPVMKLDDGTVLSETIAICRYLEEVFPTTPLFGEGAKEKALVEMWQRQVELDLLYPIAQAFRHIHPAMKGWEVPQIPKWGEANKGKAIKTFEYLDKILQTREFIAGENFSIGDITLLVSLDFCRLARIAVPDEMKNLNRLYSALKNRPASLSVPI